MGGVNQLGLFLALAKKFARENGVLFVPRKQNRDFMMQRGMSMGDLESVIMGLDESDCISGPEPDRDESIYAEWTVAKFSPTYEGEKLYLKISVKVSESRCKCLSVKLYADRI